MAKISPMIANNIITKIEQLYKEYESINKGRTRHSFSQIAWENTFKNQLQSLFDVAHADALKIPKIKPS